MDIVKKPRGDVKLDESMSFYDMTAQFTKATYLKKIPTEPTPLDKNMASFVSKMIMTELFELFQTVVDNNDIILGRMLGVVMGTVKSEPGDKFLYLKVDDCCTFSHQIVKNLKKLLLNVGYTGDESTLILINGIMMDRSKVEKSDDTIRIRTEQMDAFIDILYYLGNTCSKNNLNFTILGHEQATILHDISLIVQRWAFAMKIPFRKAFFIVHSDNMRKVFYDGCYHIRADGKVLKPPGFKNTDLYPITKDYT